MLDMFMNSVTLFMKGKLFQDDKAMFIKLITGIVITTVVCIVLAKIGLGTWLAIAIAGLVGGALQPYLFKDLKYR